MVGGRLVRSSCPRLQHSLPPQCTTSSSLAAVSRACRRPRTASSSTSDSSSSKPRHRSEGFGHRTANAHSLIHGYPLVYGWDAGCPLFTSANSLDSVGEATINWQLKQYVRRFRLHDNTVFSTTITSCRQINNGNASSSSSSSSSATSARS